MIGQIISLFGNNIMRYVLALYLLNKMKDALLYRMLWALSFRNILSLVGNIIAARVNNRNIMFWLNFWTAGLIDFYSAANNIFQLISTADAPM